MQLVDRWWKPGQPQPPEHIYLRTDGRRWQVVAEVGDQARRHDFDDEAPARACVDSLTGGTWPHQDAFAPNWQRRRPNG